MNHVTVGHATAKNGLKNYSLVNEARLQIFVNNYGIVEADDQFKKKVLIYI